MEKTKKARVEAGDGNGVDEKQKEFVEKFRALQDRLDKINEEASDKVLEVEKQFNKLRRPIFNKRSEAISKIPEFWITVFLAHPLLRDFINEDEHQVLEYLTSVDVEDAADVKSGHVISFHFHENPFFSDSVLQKKVEFAEDGGSTVTGAQVHWKEGKDITAKKKTAGESEEEAEMEGESESFFKWLTSSGDETADMDTIGDIIKEEIFPNPIRFFADAISQDVDDEDDVDEEDGDEDDDDGEDEAEDEAEESLE